MTKLQRIGLVIFVFGCSLFAATIIVKSIAPDNIQQVVTYLPYFLLGLGGSIFITAE